MTIPELLSLLAIVVSLILVLPIYLLNKRTRLLYQAINSKVVLRALRLSRLKRRLRKRYMIFEVISSGSVDRNDLEAELRDAFKNLFGELHLVRSSLSVQYYDERLGVGVIRYNHIYRYKVLTALGIVRRIRGSKIMLIPVRTTGTLKKALKLVNEVTAKSGKPRVYGGVYS